MANVLEVVRQPLRSRIEKIADEENMSVEEFVEYVLRRYVEDFYDFDSEVESDQSDDSTDSDEDIGDETDSDPV